MPVLWQLMFQKTHPVSAPSQYTFNHDLHIDVLYCYDIEGVTSVHMCVHVRIGSGQPSSTRCLQKFMQAWVSWVGWPRIVTSERGTHNRCVFGKTLGQNGDDCHEYLWSVFYICTSKRKKANWWPSRKRLWRFSSLCCNDPIVFFNRSYS